MNRSQSKTQRSRSTQRNQSSKTEENQNSFLQIPQAMDSNSDTVCICFPRSAINFQNLGKNARMTEAPLHESTRINEDEEALHESLFEDKNLSILEVEDDSGNSSLLGYHYRANSFR